MIELRDLEDDDSDRLFGWRREPEVDRWMSDVAFETADEHARWFADFRADPDRRGWIITLDGAPAGFLSLTGVAGRHRRRHGVGISERRPRGAAESAGRPRRWVSTSRLTR